MPDHGEKVSGRVVIPLSEGELHVTLDEADARTIEALREVAEAALRRIAARDG